jgi:hypothetical protein
LMKEQELLQAAEEGSGASNRTDVSTYVYILLYGKYDDE